MEKGAIAIWPLFVVFLTTLIAILGYLLVTGLLKGDVDKKYITIEEHEKEIKQAVAILSATEKLDNYNAGYRNGRADAFFELIECDKVQDKKLQVKADAMSVILQEVGELDPSPYPCQE